MQTASGHYGPDTQELVFGKIMRTNFQCRMKHQYSPYCNLSVLIEILKLTWPWTQRIAQRFCSDGKGSSLHLQQHIAADAGADRLLYLCMWEIQTSSQPGKLWLQTNVVLPASTTLNCHISVSETCSTSVLDWALYPSRFRQYLSLLHQQQKHLESYNLNWKGFIRTQYKIKFWSFYNCKFK